MEQISKILDKASNFFAHRKGLLPLIGILLVLINFIIQFFVPGWIAESNLFLHIGVIISIIGMMLAWAL
ncbi:MAG: hypothetical protein CL609_19895 [Anaerolineaceae bacterium]|nr:hypothetical protein [Anaerolineaceae bacterium]